MGFRDVNGRWLDKLVPQSSAERGKLRLSARKNQRGKMSHEGLDGLRFADIENRYMMVQRRGKHFGVFPDRSLHERFHDLPVSGSGLVVSRFSTHSLKEKLSASMKENAGNRAPEQGCDELRAKCRTFEDRRCARV